MYISRRRIEKLREYFGASYKILYGFVLFFIFFIAPSVSYAETFSRAVVVMNASTGKILYAKNPNLRLPPASTTKLITAIVGVENAKLSDIVTISKHAANVSPHKAGFKKGDKVTIEDLLYAALLGSANDATVAIAEAIAGSEKRFVRLMNKKASEIGAKNTHFKNSNGLPGKGQYTTAHDLSLIMNYALQYPILKQIMGTRVTGVLTENGNDIFLKNTNKLLWSEEDLVGGKTGYTRRARHCFVCAAERDNETIIISLLGSPRRDYLWKETEELIAKGFQAISNNEESIFVTRTDNDSFLMKKASYQSDTKSNSNVHRKTKSKKKHIATKKGIAKRKVKKVKKYKIAENSENKDKG